MQLIRIQKKSGAYRTVCAPEPELKAKLRAMVGRIEEKARKACLPQVLQGFARGRSPVTNALAHVGRKYTLCFDLQDFFDSVRARQLRGKLSTKELSDVLIDPADGRGLRAVQGLPTSPATANLAAADLDKAILRALEKAKHQAAYTRYADDLTFSFDNSTIRHWLLREIPQIVTRGGFKIKQRMDILQEFAPLPLHPCVASPSGQSSSSRFPRKSEPSRPAFATPLSGSQRLGAWANCRAYQNRRSLT